MTQENFNLNAKLDLQIRLLNFQSQEHDDQQKNRLDLEKDTLKLAFDKKLTDLKKQKLASDDEISQLNLKLQQKNETIDNLHSLIEKKKSESHVVESSSSLEGDLQEMKTALLSCYDEKCIAEEKLEEFVHDAQRKNLEVETLRRRMSEVNEELEHSQKELCDCYKHVEVSRELSAK